MRGSRNFFQGGGGGPGPTVRKQSGQHIFFYFFCSPCLILQFTEGVQWFYYRENYSFPRIQRVSNIFQGVQLFSRGGWGGGGGGPDANFYRNPYGPTCDFPGGVQTPYPPPPLPIPPPPPPPPLWISTCIAFILCKHLDLDQTQLNRENISGLHVRHTIYFLYLPVATFVVC